MSAEGKDSRGWGRRIDGLIKRVGDEVGGERGEKVRERLTEAKSRVEAGLESEEARRVRGEVTALGDKAMERVDEALRHERTQEVVKRVDAALTEIGDRLRGEHPEPPTAAPPPQPRAAAPESEPTAAETEAAAARAAATAATANELAEGGDASSGAVDASPAISKDGEEETPAKRS